MKQKNRALRSVVVLGLCFMMLFSFVPMSYAKAALVQTEINPGNGIHYVIPDTTLDIHYDRAMLKGKGNIVIASSDGSQTQNIDVLSPAVTFLAGNTVAVIDPPVNLLKNKTYNVNVDLGAFVDQETQSIPSAAITEWSFDTNQVLVTFDTQGGLPVPPAVYVDCKTLIPEPVVVPVKAGFVFRGWYEDAACSNPWDFATEQVVPSIESPFAKTLYAKWLPESLCVLKLTVNKPKYGSAKGQGNYNAGDLVKITAIPKPGCRFVRWLEGRKLFSTDAVYTFEIKGSCTIKAEFVKIGTPVITQAKAAGQSSIYLKFKSVKGAKGYDIYRCQKKFGKYEKVGSTENLNYTDTGLKAGMKYYYKIKAYCIADKTTTYSSFSNRKTAVPK